MPSEHSASTYVKLVVFEPCREPHAPSRRHTRSSFFSAAELSPPKPKAAKKKNATMTLLQVTKSATDGSFDRGIPYTSHC